MHVEEPHSLAEILERSRARREAMIQEQIIARGVTHADVLAAMRNVPRELFLPITLAAEAYDDRALPIGPDQTISQPYIVAYMTEALLPDRDAAVLEIGTGTGYQSAILAACFRKVFSIERDTHLSQQAAKRLARLGVANVELRVGDGSLGWPEKQKFDRIIVTAAAPRVPESLLAQLRPEGIMVLPVGADDVQTIVRVSATDRKISETYLLPCRFVRLIGAQGWSH